MSPDTKATLVVGAVESLSAYVLPSHLASLRERWPKARFEVITSACAEIRDSVLAGKIDLGLVLGAESANEDDDTILATGRLVIVCAPSHPLAGVARPAS